MRATLRDSALALRGLIAKRPEVALFALGLAIFAGGLLGVLSRQLSVDQSLTRLRASPRSAASSPVVTGPAAGEPLRPYIQGRRAVLARRVSESPDAVGVGAIVFASYRTLSQVESFAASGQLSPVAVHLRVPVETFNPERVGLGRGGVRGAIEEVRTRIRGELGVLEGVLSDVSDRDFKAVYSRDAERKREALRALDGDPAVIFALVARNSYSRLAEAGRALQVRYVDIPDEMASDLSQVEFRVPLPEDVERLSGH